MGAGASFAALVGAAEGILYVTVAACTKIGNDSQEISVLNFILIEYYQNLMETTQSHLDFGVKYTNEIIVIYLSR